MQEVVANASDLNSLGGFFTLSYEGKVSDRLNHAASTGSMKSAVEALTGFTHVVVRRYIQEENREFTWRITFPSSYGDVKPLSANGSGLYGANAGVAVRQISQGTTALGGHFSLQLLEEVSAPVP